MKRDISCEVNFDPYDDDDDDDDYPSTFTDYAYPVTAALETDALDVDGFELLDADA